MSEPFIGEIRLFAGNFAPRGWAFCEGQELPISENTALFSLIGTTYGGDGRSTVGLPDLRGRTAVHAGNVSDLPARQRGDQTPSGNETLRIISDVKGLGRDMGYSTTQRTVTIARMKNETGTYRHARMGMNYIIALQGLYPTRN